MVVEINQRKYTMWEEDHCYNGTQSRVLRFWITKEKCNKHVIGVITEKPWIWKKKGWPLSSLLCFLPIVKIFRGALICDITTITIDWISRHLYFVWKESQNGMQIFDVDLERKVKYPRKLKIGNRNSTIISFSIYPLLRYVKHDYLFLLWWNRDVFNVICLVWY